MGAQHHPFIGQSRIVVEQGLGFGRTFLGLDGQADRREARRAAHQARRRLWCDTQRGNAVTALAARRTRHHMAGQRPGDQKARGAISARHVVLAPAMDGAGGEHQLMAHQHDTASDIGCVRFEFFRRAAAEIDDFGGEPIPRRGNGPHQRMAGCRTAVWQAQGRRLRPPAAIGHRDRTAGIGW